MAHEQLVEVTREGELAWVVLDSPPVNATSAKVRAGLMSAVEAVRGARAAVLICRGRTFIAGGDMTEFDAPAVEPHLPDLVQAIEDSPVPFIAAMHGTVLGGGFEIAMGCAFRIAAPGTRFGLPEVNVGIIPGAGGSQRLPRLVGMEAAVDMATSGRMIDARRLRALGGLDAIAEGDLEDAARAFAADLPARPLPVSARDVAPYDADKLEEMRAAIAKRARGQRSPMENFKACLWAADLPFAEGQVRERARHLELRHSPESRALRHAFFAERAAARPRAIAGARPRDIDHVAVVGGGLMGAGIATAALNAGLRVTMIERDTDAARAGADRVHGLLDGAAKRGKASPEQAAARKAAFAASADYAAAAGADLAIEAVFEDLAVKQQVFAALAAVMGAEAILATNTSYLDPREIFAGIENPARTLGLHFFSPAHIMKLLEIVNTPDTAPEVLATGFALARKLRKTPVLSGICDGFIGNRMLSAYRREADYLLADGALPHEVDAAMRDFGMPMGPYELQDLTGLQIAWANRKRQAATRPASERYIPFGDMLCEQERFGQRSGRGWYLYPDGARTPTRDPEVEAMISDWAAAQGIARRSFAPEEIQARLMAVLANEGALIIAEGIAEGTEAVDVVQMAGYGFPRWRGGPMQYAGEIGWQATAEAMGRVAAQSPDSWRIADFSKLDA
ncbi:MAG TPA: enoyl-CoA hydratase [Aliiroseovarius sp.]|nr:enoyl-CoA hydratase [Aliiroseovarius sp.]